MCRYDILCLRLKPCTIGRMTDTDTPAYKTCTACGLLKPLTDYYKDARRSDGRFSACKPCHVAAARPGMAAYQKAHRQEIVDRCRAERARKRADGTLKSGYPALKRWRQAHPEEYRRRNSQYKHMRRSKHLIAEMLERDGHRCLRCGATENLCPDHVKPVAKGGTNTIGNLQTLCRACNGLKAYKNTDYRKPAADVTPPETDVTGT